MTQSKLNFKCTCWIVFLLSGSIGCTPNVKQKRSIADWPESESFTVMVNKTKIGYLKVDRQGANLTVDYDYKNNGRGPTIKESITLGEEGLPIQWDIHGNSTFGNEIDEHFELQGTNASWTDATGSGTATVSELTPYLDQSGSPYSLALLSRALLNDPDQSLPMLPSGMLRLEEMESIQVKNDSSTISAKTYAMIGAGLNPNYVIIDENQDFFALITPKFIIIKEGFEGEEEWLRQLSAKYAADRYETLQGKFAHHYNQNIRIKNVRIFDPISLELTDLSSVLIEGEYIKSIGDPSEMVDGEVVIDGAGGILVAGLYDMHAHMGDNAALRNILAGVTSVRDMGNQNEVLDSLVMKIESGVLAGPRITRLGFIEGKSPYNSNNGILVTSEEEGLAAVAAYDEMGFPGIKLYNSMNGDWAPALVKEAHSRGMTVTGHVPAFSTANDMIRAGFDELTHINQTMLGWVLEPEEDTRTLLRLTALKRLPDLDLNSPRVQETLDLYVENDIVHDPTIAIHEALLLGRNGETARGTIDYIDHMPPSVQRSAKEAWASIADEEEDQAYRGAYDQIMNTLKMMKERGVLLVPGTDLGGAFTLHRELELFQELGYTPAEVLKLDTYDMAKYLGHEDRGEITPGMLADFFLIPGDPTQDLKAIKTISMVSKGGTIYFPSEIYPSFGIKPFTEAPEVSEK